MLFPLAVKNWFFTNYLKVKEITMRRLKCLITSFFLMFLTGLSNAQQLTDSNTISHQPVEHGYFLSGPHTHKNLSVYFIHNKAQVKKTEYVPLEEALEKGIVRVNETGDVNNLTAENLSPKYHVFIQSGDIVKGGKQDRTIGQDVVLAPKSGKVPLNAFCVEQGRWETRGREKVQQFSSSNKRLSSKELKIAAKRAKSQGEVWKAVEEEQQKLGRKLGKSVKSEVSDSSLQLTFEDKDLRKASEDYSKAISRMGLKTKDIVGYAYTINGTFNTADIYESNDLFNKIWNKALEAAAYEAVAAPDPVKPLGSAPSTEYIAQQINSGLQGKVDGQNDYTNSQLVTREAKDNYAFETLNKKGEVIHLNVIHK
jgi:predicted DNA-binding WGR domain protein